MLGRYVDASKAASFKLVRNSHQLFHCNAIQIIESEVHIFGKEGRGCQASSSSNSLLAKVLLFFVI
jgi:hypothetical protein